MVTLFRAVVLGLLLVGVVLHVIGLATNSWVSATLDSSAMGDVEKTGQTIPKMTLNRGLWKLCAEAKLDMGQSPGSSGMPAGPTTVCQSIAPQEDHGWVKGVKALCILSLIVATLSLVFIIYSFMGDIKGDRARLLPYITGGTSFFASVLLLIGAIVYSCKYMDSVGVDMMKLSVPQELVSFLQKYMALGYSFGLEVTAAVLYLIAGVTLVVSTVRGWNTSLGGSANVV